MCCPALFFGPRNRHIARPAARTRRAARAHDRRLQRLLPQVGIGRDGLRAPPLARLLGELAALARLLDQATKRGGPAVVGHESAALLLTERRIRTDGRREPWSAERRVFLDLDVRASAVEGNVGDRREADVVSREVRRQVEEVEAIDVAIALVPQPEGAAERLDDELRVG